MTEIILGISQHFTIEGIRRLLTPGADPIERAIVATSKTFEEFEGLEGTLHKWTCSKPFLEFFDRVYAGEGDIDDELISSFIHDGEFFMPTEEEAATHATNIVVLFLGHLLTALYSGQEGLLVLANRQETLHRDTRDEINQFTAVGFADLRASLPSIIAQEISAATSPTAEFHKDQAHIDLAQKIDLARDLIKRGSIHSAQAGLELLNSEHQDIPSDLKFRIVTNLGACAMADGNKDIAIARFNEAHDLLPDNLLGIGNAALAALLAGDHSRARELAIKVRALDQRDSQATHVLMSVLWEEDSEELEGLLKAEEWIKQDKRCGLAFSRIRIHQSRFAEAAELCRSLVDLEPEDAGTHLALSECLLAYALGARIDSGSGHEFVMRLLEAEAEATTAIDLLSGTELSVQRQEALVSRAGARALMGATADAMKDLNKALSEAPGNPDALLSKGLLLLEERRPEEARAALEGTRNSERFQEALVPLAQACILSDDEGAAAEILKGTFSLEDPSWDEVRRAEMYYRAQATVGDRESAVSAIKEALQQHPDNPKLLALDSVRCGISDDLAGAEESLLKALDRSAESDRREIHVRLGVLYQDQGRFSEAADRFSEDVDGHVAHPFAVPLFTCLVNAKRLREALEWARSIREQHPQPARIALEVEADILNFVGDVPKEIACREALCNGTEGSSVDYVKLALSQLRGGKRDEALATVHGIRVSDLRQEPKWLMTLAKLKLILGDDEYLDTAYLARRLGINDPEVHLGYFGLFLGRDKDWVEPEIVGPGCAVLLKNKDGERWWQILDEGEESFGPHEVPHNDDLSMKLNGLRSGDSVVLREGLEDLSYDIATIQSKYVRVIQETVSEFSTRFPGHMGMSRVSVENNDFTRVFRTIDQRHQMVSELEAMYLAGQLALVSISSLLGRSLPEVWSACTSNSFVPIHFRSGVSGELSEACTLLGKAEVVVLDMVSLLTMHSLEVAGMMRSRFSRVEVPQLIIDQLQELHFETHLGPRAARWLGKGDDGHYDLVEISEQGWDEWKTYVESLLRFAESFERIPSYLLLDVDEVEAGLDALTQAGVGALFASHEQREANLVLVCDDLWITKVGRAFGTNIGDTQAVLGVLLESGYLNVEKYSEYIERLTLMNYRFVEIRAEDVIRRLEAHGYMTTVGSRAMIKALEGPDCDEDSAVSVATEVLVQLVGRVPFPEMNLITSLIVETLKRGRRVSPVLFKLRNAVYSRLASSTYARNMVLQTIDLHIGTADR